MRAEHGFTLVEVLAAISLTALVFLAVAQAFDVGAGSWSRGEQQADLLQSGRFLLTRLDFDIQNAYLSPRDARVTFLADEHSLDFASFGYDGRLLRVIYRYDASGGKVLRSSGPVPVKDGPEASLQEFLAGVAGLSFRFYDEQKHVWYTGWDSRQSGRLPSLVESTLTLGIPGNARQSKRFPAIVSRVSAGHEIAGPALGR